MSLCGGKWDAFVLSLVDNLVPLEFVSILSFLIMIGLSEKWIISLYISCSLGVILLSEATATVSSITNLDVRSAHSSVCAPRFSLVFFQYFFDIFFHFHTHCVI